MTVQEISDIFDPTVGEIAGSITDEVRSSQGKNGIASLSDLELILVGLETGGIVEATDALDKLKALENFHVNSRPMLVASVFRNLLKDNLDALGMQIDEKASGPLNITDLKSATIKLGSDYVAVNVYDPVITLIGDNPLVVAKGDTYTDPGATAENDLGDDISGDIIVGGDTVDDQIVSTYKVTYNVTDADGNVARTVTRSVSTKGAAPAKPVITLIGDNPLHLAVGDTYTDPGATAQDPIDGDISSSIVVAGDVVDTSTIGTYNVTYDVINSANTPADTVIRVVKVT